MKECMHSKILILILPHSTILDNFLCLVITVFTAMLELSSLDLEKFT